MEPVTIGEELLEERRRRRRAGDPRLTDSDREIFRGLLIAETLAAGLAHGRQLWFGLHRNVGHSLAAIAGELEIALPCQPQGARRRGRTTTRLHVEAAVAAGLA